jgi:hypothetical protein
VWYTTSTTFDDDATTDPVSVGMRSSDLLRQQDDQAFVVAVVLCLAGQSQE